MRGLLLMLLASTSTTDGFGVTRRLYSPRRPRLARRCRSVQRMAVWSNPQAIEDYQNLLAGKAEVVTNDCPSCFVMGAQERDRRLAKALVAMNPQVDDVLIAMDEPLPMTIKGFGKDGEEETIESFPIYLCVSADELESVIESCPEEKRDDLVFLSDGFIEPLLKSKSLCRKENTQATLWIEINEFGVIFDGLTNQGENANAVVEYAGESAATGKWAGSLIERLDRDKITCKRSFYNEWRRTMVERVVYLSVMPLVGALHPKEDGTASSLQDVGLYFQGEVDDMVHELGRTLRGHMAITLLYGTAGRLCDYAVKNGQDEPAVVTDYKWRNGLFHEISKNAIEKGFGDTCEMHTEYLEYGAMKGYFSLPDGASVLNSLSSSPGESGSSGPVEITVRLGESIGARISADGSIESIVPGGQIEEIGGVNPGDRIVAAGGTSLGTGALEKLQSIIQEKTSKGMSTLELTFKSQEEQEP